jgi:hypothetical protein
VKTEADFFNEHVGPAIRAEGVCSRVENSAEGGTPDVSYALYGYQGWIETKIVRAGKLHFEKFQIPWMRKRLRATNGVGVYVLCTDFKVVWLFDAIDVVQAPKTLHEKWTVVYLSDLTPVATLTKPWRWSVINAILAQRSA